jgi:hypothetical protein
LSTFHGVAVESGAQFSWPSTHSAADCGIGEGTMGSALAFAFSFVHVVIVLSPVIGIP